MHAVHAVGRGHPIPHGQTGQWEQEQGELSAAIDLYRAMDTAFWLPQAEAALAQVAMRSP